MFETVGSVGPVGPVGSVGTTGPAGVVDFGGPSTSDSPMIVHEKPKVTISQVFPQINISMISFKSQYN